MPTVPWTSISPAVAGKDYLALISYLPLRHFLAVPKFFSYTLKTRRQLRTANGLIGYALDAKPFARKFWTLSVWEDQQSLNEFVRQMPHSAIMQGLAPHMGKSQFAQWRVAAGNCPWIGP